MYIFVFGAQQNFPGSIQELQFKLDSNNSTILKKVI